jgi:hypothetical protein
LDSCWLASCTARAREMPPDGKGDPLSSVETAGATD